MKKILLISFILHFSLYADDDLIVAREYKYSSIAGDEYWVFDDSKPGNPYSRNEIIWSFNAAPKSAQECARTGFKQLNRWLENSDSIVSKYLKLIGELGGVTTFYLWTNDYSVKNAVRKGANPRPARIWVWEEMFIKYESTVLTNGECRIPKESEVISSLANFAQKYEEERINNLNFVQRIFDGPRSKKFKIEFNELNQATGNESGVTGQ